MNILDILAIIPGLEDAFLGQQPDEPVGCVTLYEYDAGAGVEHHFGGIDTVYGVQARVRDETASGAYARAEAVSGILGRFHNGIISSVQATPILDIGMDMRKRQEYTVNFQIRRL